MITLQKKSDHAQLRIARYYIRVVQDIAAIYKQGQVAYALQRYDTESNQVEGMLSWLEQFADDHHETSTLFLEMLVHGSTLFTDRLDPAYLLSLYYHALNLVEAEGNPTTQILLTHKIAETYAMLGQYQESLESFQRSSTLAQETNHLEYMASSLFGMGKEYLFLGLINESILSVQGSLIWYQKLRMDIKCCICLSHLGFSSMYLGEWEQAKIYLEDAYSIAKKLDDKPILSRIFGMYGNLYGQIGNLEESEFYLLEAYKIAKSLGDAGFDTSALWLATYYDRKKDYEKALHYYFESLALAQKYGVQAEREILLLNIGYSYYLQGDYVQACQYMEAADELSRNVQNPIALCVNCANLVAVYLCLERSQDALDALQKGIGVANELNSVQYQVMMIVAGVQFLVKTAQIAEEANQHAIMRRAIAWASFVYNEPHAEKENHDELDKLRPDIDAVLGEDDAEQLLSQPSNLLMEAIIQEIEHLTEGGRMF